VRRPAPLAAEPLRISGRSELKRINRTGLKANEGIGAEAPRDLALDPDPVRARDANTTIVIAAVTVAAILVVVSLVVFVLEARASSIASAQSPEALRIAILARTNTTAAQITDMIAVGMTMIILAQSLRAMARLCTREDTGRGEIIRRLIRLE
jgi:hypothetical protein